MGAVVRSQMRPRRLIPRRPDDRWFRRRLGPQSTEHGASPPDQRFGDRDGRVAVEGCVDLVLAGRDGPRR